MRILKHGVCASPDHAEFARLSFQVSVESRQVALDYWIDFPKDLGGDLSDNGDWQAIVMLPLAAYFNEPIFIDDEVDRQLSDNLLGVMQIWSSWYDDFNVVEILPSKLSRVDKLKMEPQLDKRTLSCFSGGIDSLFTLTRHNKQVLGDGNSTIDELLAIAGFNTHFADAENMIEHLAPFSSRFGKKLVPIITNMRYGSHPIETPYSDKHWMVHVAHGGMLALMAHLFPGRYRSLLIPATHSYDHLMPFGSHPLTDELFSSSMLQVRQDGAPFSRIERTRFLATSDLALETMHVCWKEYAVGNCSQCEKCVRTMLTLDLLGVKDRATAFEWSTYSDELIENTWLTDRNSETYYREIWSEAVAVNRFDLAAAVEACIKKSSRRRARFHFKKIIRDGMRSHVVTRALWNAIRRPKLKDNGCLESGGQQ